MVGSNKLLDMMMGAATGQPLLGQTTDANFAARANTFFSAYGQTLQDINATGVEVFMQLRERLAGRHITLHISGIKLPVEKVLRRAGALNDGPLLRMYRTDVDALQAFGRLGG